MNAKKLIGPWITMSMLFASTIQVSAQCNAPTALKLSPPQTSTALVLKWALVPGVAQYQIRYWNTALPDEKTIIDNCGPSPFTMRGLRKSTQYTFEIRSKCGNDSSNWGAWITASTIYSGGQCNNVVTGVSTTAGASEIQLSWTSTGSHTIRYRLGNSGDWLIPPGALNLFSSPFTISGLSPGSYQVEIKRNCSSTTGDYQRSTVFVTSTCAGASQPVVTPGLNSALVALPPVLGVSSYNLVFRQGTTGNWNSGGNNITSNMASLPLLAPSTQYQVKIQAVCLLGTSDFSAITTFSTLSGTCLNNKNAGKYMSAAEIRQLNENYNNPSPFSFGSMIGVNDGGLIFRSFQNESFNPITQLTRQLRNFHTMDEDFNANMTNYALSLKPKNTSPEGTPANMGRNKGYYSLYRQTHGFTNITGALELLQYEPQSWKEKIYQESDWSASGPAGIQAAFENYTKKFIDEFAPVNASPAQILVANYQVGNELWDYPIKADYHSLLMGSHNALTFKYGPKSGGGWKMKYVAGAFQAARDNTCTSMLRDFSNCGGSLERHDAIGDYLEVPDCEVLIDLDAIDCHPYSFKTGTLNWTYPEDPESETWQIRAMAAWLNANRNATTGVLNNTQLWSTEFGYDSNPNTGVGEKTQSAYLLRGLFLHSRYHYEKLYFYNAFDVARPTDNYYYSLYSTSGFWRLGTHPNNSSWPSPIPAHGATPKPSWFGMLDMKSRFGDHVFYKALVEDADAYVILIAKPDGSDPYLVFWSPLATNDNNINQDIAINKSLNWTGLAAGTFKLASSNGQNFAESAASGQTFQAVSGTNCGSTTLTTIRRSPAFIRLVDCSACQNITNPGTVLAPSPSAGGNPFDAALITSTLDASGGTGGNIIYQWQQSSNNILFTDIPGANSTSYDPPSLTQSTYFRRTARRSTCSDELATPALFISVGDNGCSNLLSFNRTLHTIQGCNSNGDYYYELSINQVNTNNLITISGVPSNGINTNLSTLNGVPFNTASFQANLHFINNTSMNWLLNKNLGTAQNLRLYYCWADSYPNPVNLTTATDQCSGLSISCAPGFSDPDSDERSITPDRSTEEELSLKLYPNPGRNQLQLSIEGAKFEEATIRIVSANGQSMIMQHLTDLVDQQVLELNTSDFPTGIYFVCLQTGKTVKRVVWERL